MKTKIFGGIAVLAIALAIAFNVSLNLNKSNNQLSLLALANVEALAGDETPNVCKKIEKTLTASSMYVTEITGQAAAGISIGTKFNSNWSAQIKGAVKAENKDEYKIECYEGGKACCTAMDWKQCASAGCPKAGERRS